MIDISKGRFWDLPWSLVDGCTPCSPGCDRCWAAGISHRFKSVFTEDYIPNGQNSAVFNGKIQAHPERLSIPLKRKKPTVYAVWNDLFHVDVPDSFCDQAYAVMALCKQHTFLILTKRHGNSARYWMQGRVDLGVAWWEARRYRNHGETISPRNCGIWPTTGIPNIWHGLTVCNQQEADEKIPVFLQVSGKKFLSIEPCLSEINIEAYLEHYRRGDETEPSSLDSVILGGETGPGARPLHPDWARSVRDQCTAAGVPFFFKGWGKHVPDLKDCFGKEIVSPYSALAMDVHRLLDGRTHDELPWKQI